MTGSPRPRLSDRPHSTEARPNGFGPLPHAQGVAFRVWAPNAEAVSVVGAFNDWNARADPLERDENGNWFADVPGAAPGDEYRYRITHCGESFTRIDPRARALTDSKGNAVVHDPAFDWEDDDFTPAPIESLVLYELHVGTFNASGRRGTLASAAQRLGHLRELGVSGVTLMPVTEFVGDSGWGYDTAHLYAVESSYGGPEALKEFVKAAHREGIAVFLDLVYNHLGFEDNLLWRFDGWHERDGGGIYFFQDAARADTPWGPRPDYGRREVRDYVLDNVAMWFEEYRVDGLRVDGTFHLRTASHDERGEGPLLEEGWTLLQEMTDMVRRRFPRALMIAEDMRGDPRLTRSTSEDGAGFHCQWSDKFAKTARMSLDTVDRAGTMNRVREALLVAYDGDLYRRVIFDESHDNAGKDGRIPAVAVPDDPEGPHAFRRAALSATVVFTAPGVPQLFQGEDLLDPRPFDMQNPHPLAFERVRRFAGVFRFWRDLIALRRNRAGTTAGLCGPHVAIVHADAETGVMAWRRWKNGGPGDDVLVVANFSNEFLNEYAIEIPGPGHWHLRLDTAAAEYGIPPAATGSTSQADHSPGNPIVEAGRISLHLAPWASVILSQEP